MKITKNTKIGDVLPDGWELREDLMCGIVGTAEKVPKFMIPLKKKEKKNFELYLVEYWVGFPYEYLAGDENIYIKELFKKGKYEEIPFELKIGLLKFICDDLMKDKVNTNSHKFFFQIIDDLERKCIETNRTCTNGTLYLLEICPKNFLTSLFKIKKDNELDENIVSEINDIIINLLGVEETEMDENAKLKYDLGADSLDIVELQMKLDEQFGINISTDDVIDKQQTITIGEIYEIVQEEINKNEKI